MASIRSREVCRSWARAVLNRSSLNFRLRASSSPVPLLKLSATIELMLELLEIEPPTLSLLEGVEVILLMAQEVRNEDEGVGGVVEEAVELAVVVYIRFLTTSSSSELLLSEEVSHRGRRVFLTKPEYRRFTRGLGSLEETVGSGLSLLGPGVGSEWLLLEVPGCCSSELLSPGGFGTILFS